MTPDIPRPEYPRPQLVRPEWLNLNGEWEFGFDDANHGLQEGWCDGRTLPLRILVPFAYQTALSGIDDKGIHEVVWYARDLEIPSEWLGNDLLLHFGAVDYRTTVWVNGREVGHNYGGHVPFAFDIAPYAKEGRNRICLRVEDRQDPHQPRGKQSSTGQPFGIDYYCTTGIWQTVWLEPVPALRIDALCFTSHVEAGAVTVTAHLHAPAASWRVEVLIFDGDQQVAAELVDTDYALCNVRVEIPEARLWSPESPHLYDVRVRLWQGEKLLDEVASYTGLRSVHLKNGRLLLNGEPTYLAMVLDQGYWPHGYLTAPTDAALREDVEWILRFGYNGVRKHQKIEDPRWLYWCDRLGLLVWAEMPNSRAWSPQGEEQLMAEWERAVCRDVNHACIIAWVPVNESMGFPDLREGHPGQYAFLERIVSVTRRLDPTRPVIDNDGWEHTDVTDILAVHDYSHTAEALLKHWEPTLRNQELPARIWSGSRVILATGSHYRGQPVMLTEVGGILMQPEAPREKWDRLYSVYTSIETEAELVGKYRNIMEGIAALPFVSGFCYTQLTDIEQEINGLLTFDRRPKVDPAHIAAIHRELFLKPR